MTESNAGGRTMSDGIRATVDEWYEVPEGAIYERYPALLAAVEGSRPEIQTTRRDAAAAIREASDD